MKKTISIAGIELDNHTVRESVIKAEQGLEANSFYKIQEVTMDMLMMADSNERIRQALQIMDLTIIAENEILDAVEQNTMQRQHEIAEKAFFYELMKLLERNHNTIFLLADTEAKILEFSGYLNEEFPKIQIKGMEIIGAEMEQEDGVVNEINVAHPDVVIGMLPSPQQEIFLLDNCDKLLAGLWYGTTGDISSQKGTGLLSLLRKHMKVKTLEKHITDYEEKKEFQNENKALS